MTAPRGRTSTSRASRGIRTTLSSTAAASSATTTPATPRHGSSTRSGRTGGTAPGSRWGRPTSSRTSRSAAFLSRTLGRRAALSPGAARPLVVGVTRRWFASAANSAQNQKSAERPARHAARNPRRLRRILERRRSPVDRLVASPDRLTASGASADPDVRRERKWRVRHCRRRSVNPSCGLEPDLGPPFDRSGRRVAVGEAHAPAAKRLHLADQRNELGKWAALLSRDDPLESLGLLFRRTLVDDEPHRPVAGGEIGRHVKVEREVDAREVGFVGGPALDVEDAARVALAVRASRRPVNGAGADKVAATGQNIRPGNAVGHDRLSFRTGRRTVTPLAEPASAPPMIVLPTWPASRRPGSASTSGSARCA